MSDVRLPAKSDRIAIVGRTGSGKTVAAVFHLSKQDIDKRPWFIIDYKGDELIWAIHDELRKATVLNLEADPRKIKQPGIYILSLRPGEEEAKKLEAFLWKIWERGNCGLYTDEGYMIDPRSEAFNAILTQGRSKKITMITLSQRPVWMSRFVFSEASFFQVFDLTHHLDKKKVMEFVAGDTSPSLPAFHSYYYDVGEKRLTHFGPVPKGKEILEAIDAKLPRLRRTL